MLKSVSFLPLYNSKSNDVLNDFYLPAMVNSIKYDRVSAFFDSKILRMYSKGLENIVKNNGYIRFVFSYELSEEDFESMKRGYELRNEIVNSLSHCIHEEDAISEEFSNIAYLIANNIVDVKIAFTQKGVFHDKFGIFSDEEGNLLYFRGSNNETVASIIKNYESFETSKSWECDEFERIKINHALNDFESLWKNDREGVIVTELPNVIKDKIISYQKDYSFVFVREDCLVVDIEDNRFILLDNFADEMRFYNSPAIDFFLVPFIFKSEKNKKYYFDASSHVEFNRIISNFIDYAKQERINIVFTPRLRKYLNDRELYLSKRRNFGIAIKKDFEDVQEDYKIFSETVNNLLERTLRPQQMKGAYHIAKMKRSANFSVPGAGKTSIVYGAFAYLLNLGKVNKLLMIGPKSSFLAWKREFVDCFGSKLELNFFDVQAKNRLSRKDSLRYDTDGKNLVLINYESVPSLINEIIEIVDEKTLLVFDEVHRIKAVNGKRADACLELSKKALYRVALTGTPIPNGYEDLSNMLKILFGDEYESFFGFDIVDLKRARFSNDGQKAINDKIYPFFCRTTKKELDVPEPLEDDLKTGYIEKNENEIRISDIVYREFSNNFLLLYIRLIQAETNPLMLLDKLSKDNFNYDEDDVSDFYLDIDEAIIEDNKVMLTDEEIEFIKSHNQTRKVDKTVEIVEERIKNNEKIVIWTIFLDSIKLLKEKLIEKGIYPLVITGSTSQDDRESFLDSFCHGKSMVLITNPKTLGESVSLHKACHLAIYLEYDYNLTNMIQSRDRIHRLGLEKGQKTEYIYMIMGSDSYDLFDIDKKIYYRLKEKEEIMLKAVEGDDLVYVDDNYREDIKFILGH